MYIVFTDGSSRGNPGPGGWGALVIRGENEGANGTGKHITELGGGEKHTTNNRMEIKASLEALKKIPAGEEVTVHTDSSYLINGITKWVKGWKRNGWLTKTKDEVLNRDLWEELHEIAEKREVKWQYVGGHVGIAGNERCDRIATAFADGEDIKLYSGPLAAYDLPNVLYISLDTEKAKTKKSDSSRSRAKAYSYVSMVGGVIQIHQTWAECEKRVKGMKGARFKKSLDKGDEAAIVKEFGTF